MKISILYWSVQILIWILCIVVIINRKEIKSNRKKKLTLSKFIAVMIIAPFFAFGYACMGGFPLKTDQIIFIFGCTFLIYVGLIYGYFNQKGELDFKDNDEDNFKTPEEIFSEQTCKKCDQKLTKLQVEMMIDNPSYNQWRREGYCSLLCFENDNKPNKEKS